MSYSRETQSFTPPFTIPPAVATRDVPGSPGPFRRLRLQTDPDEDSDPSLNRSKAHPLPRSKAQGQLGHRIAQGSTLPSPLARPSSKTNASPQLPTASPKPAQAGLGGRPYPFPKFPQPHDAILHITHPNPPRAATTLALLLQSRPTSAGTIPSDAQRTGPS